MFWKNDPNARNRCRRVKKDKLWNCLMVYSIITTHGRNIGAMPLFPWPIIPKPQETKKCPICPLSREQTSTAPKAHCSESTHSHWSCYNDYRHRLWCWICRGFNKSCLCPYTKQHTRTLTQESKGKILQGVSIFSTKGLPSSQLSFFFLFRTTCCWTNGLSVQWDIFWTVGV